MKFNPDNIGEAVRKMNPHLFEEERVKEVDVYKAERDLQADCEEVLTKIGYLRLTPQNCANKEVTPCGYFGHLAQPKGNAFMPDLFIFASPNTRPPLLVELKVHEDYRPGQLNMIEKGDWLVCRSLHEFVTIVTEWQDQTGVRNEQATS